jgi:hypothetical protein
MLFCDDISGSSGRNAKAPIAKRKPHEESPKKKNKNTVLLPLFGVNTFRIYVNPIPPPVKWLLLFKYRPNENHLRPYYLEP